MKYILIIFGSILFFASCKSSFTKTNDISGISTSDTLTIKNDSLEYEIIIIEPGFNSWLVTQPPRGYYGQQFLENQNIFLVAEYNRRVTNPTRFNPNLYLQTINYDPKIDYGYEVNYLLYNYFVYFQKEYNQKL
ncbi:MAG: DUF6146 family protein [Flavobacteriaceae bacterium]